MQRQYSAPGYRATVIAGITLLVAAVLWAGLTQGALVNGPVAVFQALLADGREREVVLMWRAPRLVGACVAGAALGMSGATLQRITRNPLAAPDLLGIGQGAATGAIVALLLFGASGSALAVGSVLGGVCTAGCVFALAAVAGLNGRSVLILGIAVSTMLQATSLWLLLHVKPAVSQGVSAWALGSLAGVRWHTLLAPSVIIAACVVVLVMMRPGIEQLDLGTDLARSTGSRPSATMTIAGLASVGLAAAAVAVCGPVAFIALLAPHLAARVMRTAQPSLVSAAVAGALALACADAIGQHLLSRVQFPVGVVSGALGAVALFTMLMRQRKTS